MSQNTVFRGRSTTREIVGDVIYYRYHNTTVVEHDTRRHIVTLRNGGYRTVTTKLRMNQASYQYDLGFTVHQKNFEWFVVTKAGKVVFRSGMRIDLTTGKVMGERFDARRYA